MAQVRVGFVGLGIMGQAMAANVLKAGFPLTVFNRTASKGDALVAAGAVRADSPAKVAQASDVVVSCVTASADVLEVMLDPGRGVLAGARPGLVAIDCSTVDPSVAPQCGAGLSARGAHFLDAPVSGGDVGARAGTLSIMVGGQAGVLEKVRPVLAAMGKTITHCGPAGSGYTVKLCNQILGGLNLLGVCEAIRLAESAGVDVEAMLAAVGSGAAANWAVQHLGPKVLAGDYKPGFFVDYQLKDLRLASDTCHRLGVALPGAALAETLFRSASSLGLGRQGTQALYEVIKALSKQDLPT